MTVYLRIGPEEPTEEHWRYWKSLGRFIHAFALMEREVFTLLFEKIGVDRPTAQALFSGVRAEDALSKLRRLMEVRGEALPDLTDRAFQQLNSINTARNKIVHHGATLHDGAFLVSDSYKNIPRATNAQAFPPNTIDQMTADLDTIGAALYVWLIGPNSEGWDRKGVSWAERANAPWQYKPPKPENGRQSNRDKGRGRGHPPTPSPS